MECWRSPINAPSVALAGALLEPGERVVIDTSDGATHDLVIRSIRDGIIHGDHAAIPIEAIVSIQKRELSVGKTVGLVGGLVLGAFMTWLAIDVRHAGPRVCSK